MFSTKLQPISAFQKLMIATALDSETSPGYHDIMTVRWAFRIKPGVSIRTLNRAFEKLVKRHDSLRLQFVMVNTEWKAEILPEHPVGVTVHDLSSQSLTEQNEVIAKWAARPQTALSNPMFEMHLFKCGDTGDVVLTRAHHSIIDGYGAVLLVEDLIKFVLNIPITKRAVTHEDFIKIRDAQIELNAAEKVAFWEDRLLPPPKNLKIGRLAKKLPGISSKTLHDSFRIDDILSSEQSAKLANRIKKTGTSAFCYLHAAFSHALCDMAGADEVLISSIIGRQDARLSTFVGAEMQEILTRYTRASSDIDKNAATVSREISDAAQALPTDIFFSRESRLSQAFTAADINGMRFFVHILNPVGRLANSPFRNLFSNALSSKVSVGVMSIERIELPGITDTISELFLSIRQTRTGPNASIVSDKAAFDLAEIENLAQDIRDNLSFD